LKVGEAEPFIRFYCENCGYKSTVSESYAGKKIRCPKCYYIILIPKARPEVTTPNQNGSERRKTAPKHSAYDLTLLNISEKEKLSTLQRGQIGISEEISEHEQKPKRDSQAETEPSDERKLPWLIDIFLYPFSKPGLKHLAVFIGTPMLILILWMILPVQLACLFGLITIIARILLYLYLYWYLAECIRDSAGGWVRAPQGFEGIPVLSDMFGQMVNILGCFMLFLGPFFIYTTIVKDFDIISWLLISLAIFSYPMGLLSVVLHNSARGFNLRLIINSISKTLLPYCGLVLFLVMPAMLIWILPLQLKGSLFSNFILHFAVVYIVMIDSHLLGRFYWRYQDKLNWDLEGKKADAADSD
jgi:DNA-directed RNA polymerase subunit RPC12/RpoP